MASLDIITVVPKGGMVCDIAANVDSTDGEIQKRKVMDLMKAVAKLLMLYITDASTGNAPNAKPISAGSLCYHPVDDDIYVCTDRSTPTWTKLTE